MHLLILGMNYAPEQTGIGPYTSGLAEHMVQHGHRVTVVTAFPHYPQWRQDASYAHGRRFVHWERQGVALRRGWVSIPRNRSARQRVAYDTSLAVTALLNALPLRSVDLVLSISPPLQLALTGALLAALHRAPLLLLLKDLVPDAGVAGADEDNADDSVDDHEDYHIDQAADDSHAPGWRGCPAPPSHSRRPEASWAAFRHLYGMTSEGIHLLNLLQLFLDGVRWPQA